MGVVELEMIDLQRSAEVLISEIVKIQQNIDSLDKTATRLLEHKKDLEELYFSTLYKIRKINLTSMVSKGERNAIN
jgi:prefoldin subunit 5